MTKTYEQLLIQHPKLVSHAQLSAAFDVEHLENFALGAICATILETLQAAKELFQTVLEPEVGVSQLYEQAFFTQADREKLFLLFKRISYLERQIRLAQLSSPTESVHLINETIIAWPDIRKECASFAKRLRDTWLVDEKPEKVRTFLEYLV